MNFPPNFRILMYFPDGSSVLVRVVPNGSKYWGQPIGDGVILRIKQFTATVALKVKEEK